MFLITESEGKYVIGNNTSEEKCTAFINGCDSSPEDLEIPLNIDGIIATEIGTNAFYGCTNLVTLKVDEGYKVVGSFCFCQCYQLKSVILPRSLVTLKNSAFEDCHSLSNITILQRSQLVHIGEYCFNECTNLTTFVISSSVKSVGDHTFTDIKTKFVVFYYPLNNNYDKTMFENTPDVVIYTPLNGATTFGNIPTIQVNLQHMYIQTAASSYEYSHCSRLILVLIIILIK